MSGLKVTVDPRPFMMASEYEGEIVGYIPDGGLVCVRLLEDLELHYRFDEIRFSPLGWYDEEEETWTESECA